MPIIKINPGETTRIQCEECVVEFELTLEPKAKGNPNASGVPTQSVDLCPFCGSEELEVV